MATYDLNLGKTKFQATVVEHANQLQSAITELRSNLGSMPMVGFDVKKGTVQRLISGAIVEDCLVLILFAKERCLLILMGRLGYLPNTLSSFLSDESICFVSQNASQKAAMFQQQYPEVRDVLSTATEVGPFAGRIMMKPDLSNLCSLVELGEKLGLDLKEEINQTGKCDWANICLSKEDLLITIRKAYMCYKIADAAIGELTM